MSWLDSFREFDRKLGERMNLSRRFPGYFEKWVFRGMLLVILAIVFVAGQSSGWDFSPKYYVSCPEASEGHVPVNFQEGGCPNPFYQCPDTACLLERGVVNPCPEGFAGSALCTQERILPGESIGAVPNWWLVNGVWVMVLTVFAAFVVNHALYEVRRRW